MATSAVGHPTRATFTLNCNIRRPEIINVPSTSWGGGVGGGGGLIVQHLYLSIQPDLMATLVRLEATHTTST